MKSAFKVFVAAVKDREGKWGLEVSGAFPFEHDACVYVTEQMVEVDIPDNFNPKVFALEREKKDLLSRQAEIDRQIADAQASKP